MSTYHETTKTGTLETLPLAALEKILPGKKENELIFVTQNQEQIPVQVLPEKAEDSLRTLFQNWAKASPERFRKAVFDYTSDEKILKYIWLGVSFFVVGGIGLIFLIDALHTYRCEGFFAQSSQITEAQVLKTKKNRRGEMTWEVQFTATDAQGATQVLKGKRAAYTTETGNPTVLYSPLNTACWDITVSPGVPKLSMASRWFTLRFTLGFGLFFAVVALISIALTIRSMLKRRPHQAVVEKLFLSEVIALQPTHNS